MTLSKCEANAFCDYRGYVDLKCGKWYPAMRFAQAGIGDVALSTEDYANMDENGDRFLRAPLRNPMYMDYAAAVQTGISDETLLGFGYAESDAYQKYLSADEWHRRFETEPDCARVSDARHLLYDFVNREVSAFLACFERIRKDMIAEWLIEHGVCVE